MQQKLMTSNSDVKSEGKEKETIDLQSIQS